TIRPTKVAARKSIDVTLSEPKHAITAEASHTTAQASCIRHFKMIPEAALARPSIAPIIATNTCVSYLPLYASDIRRTKIVQPIEAHIAPIARPIVVSGCPRDIRDATT